MNNNNPSFSFNAQHRVEGVTGVFLPRMYFDICEEDLVAGILLSQISYWFGMLEDGVSRVRVKHKGRLCIVKQRSEWMYECCISLKQFVRGIAYLKERGFIETEVHKSNLYNAETVLHLFINEEIINPFINAYINNKIGQKQINEGVSGRSEREHPDSAKGNFNRKSKKEHPYKAEITSENLSTTEVAAFGNFDFKKETQEFLFQNHDTDVIKKAIAYVTNPQFKVNKNIDAAIKWACVSKPWLDKSESDKKESKKNIERNLEALMGFEEFFKREKSEAIFPLPKGQVILDLTLPAKEFSKIFEQLLKTHFITSVG